MNTKHVNIIMALLITLPAILTTTKSNAADALSITVNQSIHWGQVKRPVANTTCTMNLDETVTGSQYCGTGGSPTKGIITLEGTANASVIVSGIPSTYEGITFTPSYSEDNATTSEILATQLGSDGKLTLSVVGKIRMIPYYLKPGGSTNVISSISAEYN